MTRRTLAGDMRLARSATHYFLALLWARHKDAVVPISNALILVGLVALLGFILQTYLFR